MLRLVLVLWLSISCNIVGPSLPGVPVNVSEENFNEYWTQLTRRWPTFFEGQCLRTPQLPNRDDIRSWVSFEEVSAAELAAKQNAACTFTKSKGRIRIGDIYWGSGCVAHELGHAACEYLGQPDGCPWFEHAKDKRYKEEC
jgi:hypothetical protein